MKLEERLFLLFKLGREYEKLHQADSKDLKPNKALAKQNRAKWIINDTVNDFHTAIKSILDHYYNDPEWYPDYEEIKKLYEKSFGEYHP